MKTMNLSLKSLILGMVIVSVVSLFLLGSSALFFNSRLIQNQEYFLQANQIESARDKMNSFLSLILTLEGQMLAARSLDEMNKGTKLEKSYFKEGLDSLSTLATKSPEVT